MTDKTSSIQRAPEAKSAPRRAAGSRHMARALWYVRPGVVELRLTQLPALAPQEARVRMLYSGISRGTERLILAGEVPPEEYDRMRAPLQEGAFPFPVKYGYCAAGIVEDGPDDLVGRHVFCLHPHQDMFIAPVSMLVPLPDGLTPRRATLGANMETALNAIWDSGAAPGDRIVIVGAGIVGLMVTALAARMPGTDVTVIDPAPDRRALVEALGARYASGSEPGETGGNADVVFHTSASAAGFNVALAAGGLEATVVEMSWYGTRAIEASLGGAFHSRRLRLVSSQVGQVSPAHRARWTYRRRIEKALALLSEMNPVCDQFVAREIDFAAAATELPSALARDAPGLAPVLRY